MSKIDEIKRIKDLLDGGFISREEFDKLKEQVLVGSSLKAVDTVDDSENKGNKKQLVIGSIVIVILSLSIAAIIYFNYYPSNKSDNLSSGNNIGDSGKNNEQISNAVNEDTTTIIYTGISSIVIDSTTVTDSRNPKDVDTVSSKNTSDSHNASEITKVISMYYNAMNHGNFNAYDYFSSMVEHYIKLRNITPLEINNAYEKSKSEFINSHSELVDNSIAFERIENGIEYYTFKIKFSTYRNSLKKQETCSITVEAGYDCKIKKLSSYKETKVADLKFE